MYFLSQWNWNNRTSAVWMYPCPLKKFGRFSYCLGRTLRNHSPMSIIPLIAIHKLSSVEGCDQRALAFKNINPIHLPIRTRNQGFMAHLIHLICLSIYLSISFVKIGLNVRNWPQCMKLASMYRSASMYEIGLNVWIGLNVRIGLNVQLSVCLNV